MAVSTFLRIKDQVRPFATHVRSLKLELDAQETFTLSRSLDIGYTSAAAFNVGEALEIIEQLSELRALEIKLTINPRNGGVEHIAKYLRPVLKYLLRDEKDSSKVREVLKLSFQLPSSVQMEDYEDTCERAEEMLEEDETAVPGEWNGYYMGLCFFGSRQRDMGQDVPVPKSSALGVPSKQESESVPEKSCQSDLTPQKGISPERTKRYFCGT